MFDNLTERLSHTLRKITHSGRLTEENIKNTTREVRKALLEADVVLSVVKKFINNVKNKSIGLKINKSLTPGQEFIKIVKNELILAMGEKNNKLNFSVQPPAIILFIGLQGVGKTTSMVKLGKFIQEKHKKKILTVSTDIYRAAAIKQLEILSKQAKIDFFPSYENQIPVDIVQKSITYAQNKIYDVLLIDTAGRLHVNIKLMNEIKKIQILSKPIETLLVVDSMMGQDSINMANIFQNYVDISGIFLTKTDSDSRSGIALSIQNITGKSIKFIGTGEKIHQLEKFYPERMANRILGMEDVVSLIEDIEDKIDKSQIKKLTKKIKIGHNFDLNDFLIQIKQMKKIGGLNHLIEKFFHKNILPENQLINCNENTLNTIEAIICSMTPKEKMTPKIIKGSRKKRIALGSGTNIQDINKLLKNFDDAKKMMKKIKKSGLGNMMRGVKNFLPKKF
ncbi:signal recognition particle protein [Buchnera aphidicola]|uniref:signal recognition particle protein n=1 Tax=Buchnera aphidicola TaxID=9 RepID=UPI0034639136